MHVGILVKNTNMENVYLNFFFLIHGDMSLKGKRKKQGHELGLEAVLLGSLVFCPWNSGNGTNAIRDMQMAE